jgi:MoaA/NifB/PqqE/SkfB family radical SAM enzyme
MSGRKVEKERRKSDELFVPPNIRPRGGCSARQATNRKHNDMDIIHYWEKAVLGKINEADLFSRLAKSYPPICSVAFTRECVLRCKHCIYPEANCQDLKMQDLAKIDRIIDASYGAGIRDLVHVGRILKKEHLSILKKYFDKGMKISLIDNGSGKRLIPEIKKMELFFNGGVDISVDGNKITHDLQRGVGTWQMAMDGIRELAEVASHVSVTGTASRLNYRNIVGALHELSKKDASIKVFQITTTSPARHHTERMHLTKNQMRKLFKDAVRFSNDFEFRLAIYRFEDIVAIADMLESLGKPRKKYIHIEWKLNKLKILYFPVSIVAAEEIAIDANGRHVLPFGLDHHLAERLDEWEVGNDLVLSDPDKSHELMVEKYLKTLGGEVFRKEKKLFEMIVD